MLYAVYCVDKPNAADLRAELRPPHQEYLATQTGIIERERAVRHTITKLTIIDFLPSPREISHARLAIRRWPPRKHDHEIDDN